MLTIGNESHLAALAGWDGRVVVKLASGMQRFGGTPALVDAARTAGLDVVGVSIHPPLAGTGDDHAAEITRWLPSVDPSLPVWVSHLDAPAYASLPADTHVPQPPRHVAVARRQERAAPVGRGPRACAPSMAAIGRAITWAKCPATVTS